MNQVATLRGGPWDGCTLVATDGQLPSVVHYPVRRDNATQEHVYTLRGTRETGYWFDHLGIRAVA